VELTPDRVHGLSSRELYLFDTTGLVRLPAYLSSEAVRTLRSHVLKLPSVPMEGRGDKERFNNLVAQRSCFAELAWSDTMRLLVEPVINQPYRLIESYALRREQGSIFYLHNGYGEVLRYGGAATVSRNMSFTHTFHDGRLFCMLVKALVYLTDVTSVADGPFCYLEGSHKANTAWFSEPVDDAAKPPLTEANFPSLRHVFAQAGDLLLINEALLHGTLPKDSEDERLVLAFSYAPAFVTDWQEIDLTATHPGQLGHY
jgi:hypothetical protein